MSVAYQNGSSLRDFVTRLHSLVDRMWTDSSRTSTGRRSSLGRWRKVCDASRLAAAPRAFRLCEHQLLPRFLEAAERWGCWTRVVLRTWHKSYM